jgi:hypothetical protein
MTNFATLKLTNHIWQKVTDNYQAQCQINPYLYPGTFGLTEWLAKEWNVLHWDRDNHELVFIKEKDASWFMLRWS